MNPSAGFQGTRPGGRPMAIANGLGAPVVLPSAVLRSRACEVTVDGIAVEAALVTFPSYGSTRRLSVRLDPVLLRDRPLLVGERRLLGRVVGQAVAGALRIPPRTHRCNGVPARADRETETPVLGGGCPLRRLGATLRGLAFAASDLEPAARALERPVPPLHRRAAAQAGLDVALDRRGAHSGDGSAAGGRATMSRVRGAVAERLGRGLQSLVQRFESARRLFTCALDLVSGARRPAILRLGARSG